MELENSFTVPTDIETAWLTMLDVERIAGCMPGAALVEMNGDTFTGTVKIKLGPIALTYGGKASYKSKDPSTHTVVIEASGSESKGGGTASADVTAQMVSEGPSTTRVLVKTNLHITGKPAQFGRGVMQDVAGRIIDQFAANLAQLLADHEPSNKGKDESINILSAGVPVFKKLIPFGAALVIIALWLILK